MSGESISEGALAVALQDLRRVTEVGLEKVNGSLALLVQRLDQADERDSHLSGRLDKQAGRVERLERNTITVEQLNARTTRLYLLLGLLVTALGVAAAFLGLGLGGH